MNKAIRWCNIGKVMNRILEFIDIMLSGIAQIVLNCNPVCGVLLTAAVFMASPVQGISCIWSVLVATLLTYFTGIPAAEARSGIYTFNPALIGLEIPLVTHSLEMAALPRVLLLTAIGSVLTFALVLGIKRLLDKHGAAPLGLPYSIALVLIGFAANPAVAEAAAGDGFVWTLKSFVEAVLCGAAQIVWLEGVPLIYVAAVIVLIGVCCASRIDALMSLLCGTLATGLAIILGADAAGISAGLYGYNAMLLSYVLFGRTCRMSLHSFILSIILTLATVPFAMGLKPLMAAIGAPVAGFPFSALGILVMLAKPYKAKLEYIPPRDWPVPEGNHKYQI